MERSKLLMWVIVAIAAGIIVWRVGFTDVEPKPSETAADAL